ncbi:MerR family transcriptional regulator [Rhodovibrionaceae bacterium A322]
MFTISELARRNKLSRTTLLYYESKGLLQASVRGQNDYRYFDEAAERRLQAIIGYRSFGLSIAEIKSLLDKNQDPEGTAQTHFLNLENKINELRRQQLALVSFLQDSDRGGKTRNVNYWNDTMQQAGLDDAGMREWHRQFELLDTQGHGKFLAHIGLPPEDVEAVRRWALGKSRNLKMKSRSKKSS